MGSVLDGGRWEWLGASLQLALWKSFISGSTPSKWMLIQTKSIPVAILDTSLYAQLHNSSPPTALTGSYKAN